LFAVLIVNGVAAAIPATLFLFFVEDKLLLGSYGGLFLILYFGAAAASMPLWVSLARRHGEARAWGAGMLLSALVFVWAYWLGAGALLSFGTICLLSGLALGADLALPPALLAGVIARAGHSGQREAAYFGLWNWGVQLNLALAAGIALPLLGWLGYVPGSGSGTQALSVAYALLPCALKLIAAFMLWRAPLRDC
jgi:GPH family glycoside/pentoside/hexuronide:cation symporter